MVEDFPRSGRPSTSSTEVNIAKVKEMVTENCHFSSREIAAELSVSHESIRTILNDCLGMKLVSAQLVLKDLNFLHKLNPVKAQNSTNIIEQITTTKLPLRGTRFQSIEDTKENSGRELKSIPENAFKKCFDDWIIRWHKCIISGWTYFEGDKINLDQ